MKQTRIEAEGNRLWRFIWGNKKRREGKENIQQLYLEEEKDIERKKMHGSGTKQKKNENAKIEKEQKIKI